jgi:phosphatidylglycerophosphate synthase
VASNLNPANAITASRFLTLPPFLYFAIHHDYQWAVLTALLCGVLDLFDGAVARKFQCQTPFGEVFDAIADGLCYGFMIIALTVLGYAPVIPVVVIIGLGAVNTLMRGVYLRRAGRTTNYRSFAMERVVAFAAYLVGFAATGMMVGYFYWACATMMAIVVLHDAKRMLIDPVPPAGEAEAPPASGAARAKAGSVAGLAGAVRS